MASISARRLVQRSSSSARAFLNRSGAPSVAPGPSKVGGIAPKNPISSSGFSLRQHPPFGNSRLPVELGCVESLIPLHSATANSLLRSMLSSEVGQWGCLSEGFATPL